MRSAPCASAPSHPLHAMPPRITRNSDRPRASDRTMVNIVRLSRLAHSNFTISSQRHLTRMGPQAKPLQGNETEWAGSRETTSIFRSRRSFSLTSLFIELFDTHRVALFFPCVALRGSRAGGVAEFFPKGTTP